MLMILASSLYDSWIGIMGEYNPFIVTLFTTQLGLSVCFLWVFKRNKMNNTMEIIADKFTRFPLIMRFLVVWLLLSFVLSPYLSFLSTALFLFGFILIILFLIGYIVLLSIERIREFLVGREAFYYLLHFAIQLIIGCCIYVGIFKVRFWEMYSFPKDEEQFLLREIYPELGVLRRCCDDIIAMLCLFAIPYLILGIYYCIKRILIRLKFIG